MEHDLSDLLSEDLGRFAEIERASFATRDLLKSKGESIVFNLAREVCGELFIPDFFVMAQVSFAELFEARMPNHPWDRDEKTSRKINGMRSDVVVLSPPGQVRLIIEVHGDGHFGREDAVGYKIKKSRIMANDAIKRHVCRSAGIPILEITGKELISKIRQEIASQLFDDAHSHKVLGAFCNRTFGLEDAVVGSLDEPKTA